MMDNNLHEVPDDAPELAETESKPTEPKQWILEDSDVWNFDSTLALFIAQGLEKLADMAHGHPGELNMETWDHMLRGRAQAFRDYADGQMTGLGDDLPPYSSLLWLAHWFGHLWD